MDDYATTLQNESVKARFWSKVDRRGADECWPWLGTKSTSNGRGTLHVGGSNMNAARVSLCIHSGQYPKNDIFACHTCDNPNCVNPSHLWWGDCRANMRDAVAKGRLGKPDATHCTYGHEFALHARNFVTPDGLAVRFCKACRRVRDKRKRDRLRAERLALKALEGTQHD